MHDEQPHFLSGYTDYNSSGSRTSKIALGVVVFLLLFFVAGLWYLWVIRDAPSVSIDPVDGSEYSNVSLEPKKPDSLFKKLSYFVFNRDDDTLVGYDEDRINILLMGQGGPGHDGPYLTDTIMLASIKPSTGQVSMISIPRDLGIDIPEVGYKKINHVNHFGELNKPDWGAAFATMVISEAFEIEIPYYMRVDFAAFQEVINDVGGVTVDVARSFTDPRYPAPNFAYTTVTFSSGVQTMDGDTALTYARSRHGNNNEGSDFARARRQQQVILALKKKILSFSTLANPVRLHDIVTSVESNMTTNITFPQMLEFVKFAQNMEVSELRHVVFDSSPDGFLTDRITNAGEYVLEPKSGSFQDMQAAISGVFLDDLESPNVTVSQDTTPTQRAPLMTHVMIEVQNATWKPGAASALKKDLIDESFAVDIIGNADTKPVEKSGIYVLSSANTDDVLPKLEKYLTIPILDKSGLSGVTSPLSDDSDVLIIIGNDFPT